ncbi:hypothetical protein [Prevotella pallens]|jgi:hypothetical protein
MKKENCNEKLAKLKEAGKDLLEQLEKVGVDEQKIKDVEELLELIERIMAELAKIKSDLQKQ